MMVPPSMNTADEIPEFVNSDYLVNKRELTVEWGHCDPAGIVFHPRFIEYFDWCCVLLLEKATGFTKSELGSVYGLAGIPIVDLQVRFLDVVSYDDRVQIYSTASELKRSSFVIRHCLVKRSSVAVECVQTRVWCISNPRDPKRLKAGAIPEEIVGKLRR